MNFIIELLAECIPELVFGSGHKKHDPMPEVEPKTDFTVCYTIGQSRVQPCLWFVVSLLCFIVSFFTHGDLRIILYIAAASSLIISLTEFYLFNFRYDVTTDRIIRTNLFAIRKEWNWETIRCVRLIEDDNNDHTLIAVYSEDGNLAFDLYADMDNAWQIVKLAETNGIEIRNEKNLSIKQINRL